MSDGFNKVWQTTLSTESGRVETVMHGTEKAALIYAEFWTKHGCPYCVIYECLQKRISTYKNGAAI